MSLDCLSTLVGLSDNSCDCLSGGYLSGANVSDSGYYITDDEYGIPLLGALFANTDCDGDTIWDVLADQRTKAIRDFETDLSQALLVEREQGITAYRGLIAKAEGTNVFPAQEKVFGIQLRPRYRYRDASFIITDLYLGVNSSETVTVTLSSNDPDFAPLTQAVTLQPNRWTKQTLPVEWEVPLYSVAVSDLRYNIYFQATADMRVRSNKIWCCSRPAWLNHMEASGFIVDSVSDDLLATSSRGSGIALGGYMACDKLAWICNLEELNGADFRDLIARAIQFKAAVRVIGYIQSSGMVNRYTLLHAEALQAKKAQLQEMYSQGITWIAQNLPANMSSCWGCSKRGPRVVSLTT